MKMVGRTGCLRAVATTVKRSHELGQVLNPKTLEDETDWDGWMDGGEDAASTIALKMRKNHSEKEGHNCRILNSVLSQG